MSETMAARVYRALEGNTMDVPAIAEAIDGLGSLEKVRTTLNRHRALFEAERHGPGRGIRTLWKTRPLPPEDAAALAGPATHRNREPVDSAAWEGLIAKGRFAMAWPPVLMDYSLSDADIRVYLCLLIKVFSSAFPVSRNELARLTGYHVNTVSNSVERLAAAGHIIISRNTTGSVWTFTIPKTPTQESDTPHTPVSRDIDNKRTRYSNAHMQEWGSATPGSGGGPHADVLTPTPGSEHHDIIEKEKNHDNQGGDVDSFSSHFEGSAPDKGFTLDPKQTAYVSLLTLDSNLKSLPDALWDDTEFLAAYDRWLASEDCDKLGIFRSTSGKWELQEDIRALCGNRGIDYIPTPHQDRNRY